MPNTHLLTVRRQIRQQFGAEAVSKFLAELSPYDRAWLERQVAAEADEAELPSSLMFDRPWLTREIDAPISLPEVNEAVIGASSPIPFESCIHCGKEMYRPTAHRLIPVAVCGPDCVAAAWSRVEESLVTLLGAFGQAVANIISPFQGWAPDFEKFAGILNAIGADDGSSPAPPISRRRPQRRHVPRDLARTRLRATNGLPQHRAVRALRVSTSAPR